MPKVHIAFICILLLVVACAPSGRQYTNQMEVLHQEWDYLVAGIAQNESLDQDSAFDEWLSSVNGLRPPRALAFEHKIYLSVHQDFVAIFRTMRDQYAEELVDGNIANCYLISNQMPDAFKQSCNLLLKAQQDVVYVRIHWTWDLLKLESSTQ